MIERIDWLFNVGQRYLPALVPNHLSTDLTFLAVAPAEARQLRSDLRPFIARAIGDRRTAASTVTIEHMPPFYQILDGSWSGCLSRGASDAGKQKAQKNCRTHR
jgi:hypothetical protein